MPDNNKEILVHILAKVDKLEEHVSAVRVDQSEIKVDLRYHILRTNLLEAHVKDTRKAVDIMLWPFTAICSILRFIKLIK